MNSSCLFASNLRETYESAEDAYNKGQYDRAIELYNDILKEMPALAPAYIGIGLSLNAKGASFDEVFYYYKMAIDKDPTNAQVLEQLGRLYYAQGLLDNAKITFEKALKINFNLPQAKLALAWIHLTGRTVNPGKAIYYFQDVLKTNPSANAYFGLGMAYFSSNQRTKALDIITQLKGMGQNELAEKLEKVVRENRKVVINNTPDSPEEADTPANSFENTSNSPKGIKVRLKGKLDQL